MPFYMRPTHDTHKYLRNKDPHFIEGGHVFLQAQRQVVERERGPGGGGGVCGHGGRRGRHACLSMSIVGRKQDERE